MTIYTFPNLILKRFNAFLYTSYFPYAGQDGTRSIHKQQKGKIIWI
jgi:hypothetical protein